MKLDRYLKESYGDVDIPGFRRQNLRCCRNCEHFIDEHGEEFFCGNSEYMNLPSWETYVRKSTGIPLVFDNVDGICPKYKENK